jgi:hypothetical protein
MTLAHKPNFHIPQCSHQGQLQDPLPKVVMKARGHKSLIIKFIPTGLMVPWVTTLAPNTALP